MEREMANLQKRFRKEQEKLRTQFVAENGTGYGVAKEA